MREGGGGPETGICFIPALLPPPASPLPSALQRKLMLTPLPSSPFALAGTGGLLIGIVIAGLILLVLAVVVLRYANLYVQALVSGARTGSPT